MPDQPTSFNRKVRDKSEIFSVAAIVAVAAILRFYNYANLSITADGASAIERTFFDSFGELIEYGVKPDFHPAFVQVLLFYWIKAFGMTTASIRIPFVVAGILSVLFSYLIAAKWFGKTTGLFTAASICFLEFPLTYAQIERPYSTGLLFSLMTAWFWTKYLFDEKSNKKIMLAFYAVSSSLCMLNHYFSFLFAFIAGATGLFFLNKENWKGYIIAGICAVAICFPHIGVYVRQLSKGGIGGTEGWLAAPESDFLWKFLFFGFNNSYWLLGLFIVVFIAGILSNLKQNKFSKFQLICLAWFLLPFVIGYYYSRLVNPVLQYSVLLFSFPFLIMFVFSFIKEQNLDIKKLVLVGSFLAAGIYNTVYSKKFYSTNHFGVLKEIAVKSIEWSNKLGDSNIAKAITLDSPYFIQYYFDQYNNHPKFFSYKVHGREKLHEFASALDTCAAPYFIYAWSTRYSPVELPEMIKEKYPYLIDRDFYFNSEFYLFSKHEEGKEIIHVLSQRKNDFEREYDHFSDNQKTIVADSNAFSGRQCVLLNDSNNFSPVFKCSLAELIHSPNDIINVSAMAMLPEAGSDAEIVIAIESEGKSYFWASNAFSFFITEKNTWKKTFFSVRIPKVKNLKDEIKIYIWNHSGKDVFVDDLEVRITEGNPVIYGKRTYSD